MLCSIVGTPGNERPLGAGSSDLTRENSMKNHIDEKEATEQLRKAGWTASEIERLRGLRRDYAAQEGGQAAASHRRSRFIRWLVAFLQEGYGQEGYGPSSPWWW